MILSNHLKSFLLVLLILFTLSGCNIWERLTNSNTSANKPAFPEDRSVLPFETREPDVYQAKMVITTGGVERIIFIAKSGMKRRTEYDQGDKSSTILIKNEKEFILFPAKKIYAEQSAPAGAEGTLPEPLDSLTTEWLNIKAYTDFENVGEENGLKKFRARMNASAASEVIISLDANNLPVRQEYYGIDGDQREVVYLLELRDIKTEAPDELLALPADYKKATIEEILQAIRGK